MPLTADSPATDLLLAVRAAIAAPGGPTLYAVAKRAGLHFNLASRYLSAPRDRRPGQTRDHDSLLALARAAGVI